MLRISLPSQGKLRIQLAATIPLVLSLPSSALAQNYIDDNGVTENARSMGGCDWGNPAFTSGGILTASGSTSISAANTFLHATAIENNFGIFFEADNQVNGGSGNPLHGGPRCAGGGLIRLTPPTTAVGNAVSTPAPIQTLASTAVAGSFRRYQHWFRTPNGPGGQMANLTNGLEIFWTP